MEKPMEGQHARIIVIDRDEVSLSLTRFMLTASGYMGSMVLFDSIEVATVYLSSATPDMVFMDYFQSYGDDFTLMGKVHATAAVQLVVTAEFLTDKQEIDRRFNNYKFLRKPLSVEVVKRVLG